MNERMIRAKARNKINQALQRVQALADISRSALCCHSNETREPIANPPNSAQLEGILPTIPPGPSYIRVRAVVWDWDDGQTERQTDRHRDGRDQYTLCTKKVHLFIFQI